MAGGWGYESPEDKVNARWKRATLVTICCVLFGSILVIIIDSKRPQDGSLKGQIVNVWTDPTTGCKYYEYINGHGASLTLRQLSNGEPDCPAAHITKGLVTPQHMRMNES